MQGKGSDGMSDVSRVVMNSTLGVAGLLGEQYIGIEAGGDTNNLVTGDRITRTQSATVLEDLINQFIYSKAAEGKDNSK
jgi:phospholipid/cholesterol/gamma-HCH transport system substrate-binding protein